MDHFGINYNNWPGGRQIVGSMLKTGKNIETSWEDISNFVEYNGIQVNFGIKNCEHSWAPKFHVDSQLLYKSNEKKCYKGILAASLQGTSAIVVNKSIWNESLIEGNKEFDISYLDTQTSINFWAKKLTQWGFIKKPGMVYGIYGMSLWFWLHAVMTDKLIRKLYKRYNYIIKQKKLNNFIVNKKDLSDPSITILFRTMDL